ncbi:tetratricopeptide repeat protein [Rubrivirga sp. IMCC45206]|uniref:tetratricopeptide repeat protein n=1 Tax=Rubrivirga sp. IMCC45206 TaxID=3391614 RepID=UPI00398FB163
MSVPPDPEIQRAARLLAEGRPAEAASRLAALVAEAPTYAAAHVLRATALEAAGEIDEALVSWGRAAALVPRSALVHRERARLLASQIPDDAAPGLPPPVPATPAPAPGRAPEPEATAPPEPAPPAPAAPEPPPPATAPDSDADPAYDDDYADGPLLGFGEPATFAADELAGDPTPTAEAPEPTAGASAPPGPAPTAASWGDETGLAPVLPPEAHEATEPAPTALSPPDVDAPTEGWSLVDEADVPAPPPAALVSPDVIAPEGDRPPPADPEPPPAEATVEDVPPPMPSVADELDSLIAQLEDAPRIKPDPAYSGPIVDPDAGNVDDLASETLAKIYAAQHQYVEAALMYEKLAARTPESAEDLLERAAELRRKSG